MGDFFRFSDSLTINLCCVECISMCVVLSATFYLHVSCAECYFLSNIYTHVSFHASLGRRHTPTSSSAPSPSTHINNTTTCFTMTAFIYKELMPQHSRNNLLIMVSTELLTFLKFFLNETLHKPSCIFFLSLCCYCGQWVGSAIL